MASNSAIQWTDATFNPWRGCTKVSPGCAACYAETLSARNPRSLGVWGPRGTRVIAAESYWREPLKWNAAAEAAGERHRVFCASLADVFEGADTMPEECVEPVRKARLRLFRLLVKTPHLDWLLLTKRPANIIPLVSRAALDCERNDETCEMLNAWLQGTAPANVWLGYTAENQARLDEGAVAFLEAPAAVHFLSCEPLLEPLDLRRALWTDSRDPWPYVPGKAVDWVISGVESLNKRVGRFAAGYIDAARSIRDQCEEAGVAYFNKQMPVGDRVSGDPAEWPEHLRVREFPEVRR